MHPQLAHLWILSVLKDIEGYAQIQDEPKIAAFISAARSSVGYVLDDDMKDRGDTGGKVEQWFHVVLDELARYCHVHGLTETEGHLLAALDGLAAEKFPKKTVRNVVAFPIKV